MPQIAELKQIDGALWARVEMLEEDGHVSLLTGAELADIKRQERRVCWEVVNELIRQGPLPEPAHSERNGLVLATNAISELL